MTASRPPFILTGRRVALIFGGFFAAILVINLAMALIARWSWSGLVVPNSYVASQQFNAHLDAAAAQRAHGWQPALRVTAGGAVFSLARRDGGAVPLAEARITLQRPVGIAGDLRRVPMRIHGHRAVLDRPVEAGAWNVRIDAVTRAGAPFRLEDRVSVRQ